jgi:soluble cytochrome b562
MDEIIKEIKEAQEYLDKELTFLKTSFSCLKIIFKDLCDSKLKIYENFFIFILIFTFSSVVLSIKKFIDKDKRSYSFHWLLERLKLIAMDNSYYEKIENEIKDFEKTYEKFISIRDKMVAHIEKGSIMDILKDGINMNDINEIEEAIQEIERIKNRIESKIKYATMDYKYSNSAIISKTPDIRINTTHVNTMDRVIEDLKNLLDKIKEFS